MPATRTLNIQQYRFTALPGPRNQSSIECKRNSMTRSNRDIMAASKDEVVDLARHDVKYPLDSVSRRVFKTKMGQTPTSHEWAVYDHVRNIPVGKVTTYKDICVALGQGSPRSVGAALRKNPFAPFIPCHRIIASNHYIGGFFGEWGLHDGGQQCRRKIDMLAKEGVGFTEKGYLIGGEAMIWKGYSID